MNLTFKGPLLLAFLLAGPSFAQDAEAPDPVRLSDAEAAAEQAEERDSLQPGVSSAELTAEVRRRTADNGVMDEMYLGRTEITGNQELPKVLYIVPWQKSDPGDLMGRPVNSLLDEVLAPVDRSEFIRSVEYYHDLHDEPEE